MNRKYLLGAAIVALVAGSGAAQAADVLPVVAAMVPAPEDTVDPLTLEIEAGFAGFWVPSDSVQDYGAYLVGSMTYKTTTGWGIEVDFDGLVDLGDGDFGASGEVEFFRSFGAFGVGVVFGAGGGFGAPYYYFGPTLRYETDTITAKVQLTADFVAGVHEGYSLYTEAEFTPSDRLALGFWLGVGFDGGGILGYAGAVEAAFDVVEKVTLHGIVGFDGPGGGVGTHFAGGIAAELNLGVISPYVGVLFDGDTAYVAGVALEYQLGNGPFTLVGNAGAVFLPGDPTVYRANIGIRFNHGDADDGKLGFFDDFLLPI
ncbi:MAG: hypothetical protein AB7O56_09605 [Bauldia sp.]